MHKTISLFPNYSINTIGILLNTKRGTQIVPTCKTPTGYMVVTLRRDDMTKSRQYVHRLVALTHIENPDNLPQVNHIDGDKTNNSVSNLEWCTAKANNQHAWDNGLKENVRAEAKSRPKEHFQKMGRAKRKYSNDDVRYMRESFNNGTMTQKELSEKYNTSMSNMGRIIHRKRYSDVE